MFSWNKYPLLRILFPFVAGILIVFYTGIVFPIWILLPITCLGMFSVLILYKFRKYQNRWVSGLLIFVSILSFSLAYTQFFIAKGKPSPVSMGNDKHLFIASVIESPVIKTKTVKLIVEIEEYKHDGKFYPEHSKAIIHIQKNEQSQKISYGDRLLFYSYLNEPVGPKNPREFNYKRYLSIKSIHIQSYIEANSWQKISGKNGNPIIDFATNIRSKLLKIFQDCDMDIQEYGVIAAILLGSSDELDPDLERSYSSAGVSHILSVSGMHVGIIFMIVSFLLRFLDRNKSQRIIRSIILLITVWFYACVTGLAPPVMRASAMFSFVAIGGMLNRRTNSYNSLMVSLIVLLLLNPLLILEVGFQFSYLAVFGIVWLQRPLGSLYKARTKIGNYVWDIITVSFAAQLLTAPLAILYFHQFPNYFLLTNIAVITLTPIVMGFGIAVLVFSFWAFAYKYLSLVLVYLIKSMNWIIVTIEALPYSVTSNIDLSALQVGFIYLLILLFIAAFLYKKKVYLFQALLCLIIVMGIDLGKQIKVNQQKEIIFHSVKSGYAVDCIEGRASTLIWDHNMEENHQTYNYGIKNNHIYHRIKEVKNITGRHFIRVHNKSILIIDQPLYAIALERKLKVNYILLHNNVNIPMDVLQKMFDFDMIITGGSYSHYRLMNIRKTCAQKIIPYHELKNQGSMVVR